MGVINMVLSIRKEFPEPKIQTLIGGFILMNIGTGRMNEDESYRAGDCHRPPVSTIFSGSTPAFVPEPTPWPSCSRSWAIRSAGFDREKFYCLDQALNL
jgi:hypothetical protein